MNKDISFFLNTYSGPASTISVDEILNDIKGGKFKDEILALRQISPISDPEKFSVLKRRLPAISFSGTFKEKRKADHLLDYSGFIVFDIDKISQDSIQDILSRLKQVPYTYACWISPSGKGIKFLVRTEASLEEHKIFFYILSHFYSELLSIEIDNSGSDVSRLCYVSFDDELYLFEEAKVVTVDFINETEKKIHATTLPILETVFSERVAMPKHELSSDLYINRNRGKGKNKPKDRIIVSEIIKYLRRFNKSITYDYDHWYKTALGLSNAFSYNVGLKYFLQLCKFDLDKHNEQKSIALFDYCFFNKLDKIKIGTVVHFAIMQGFDLSKALGSHRKPTHDFDEAKLDKI